MIGSGGDVPCKVGFLCHTVDYMLTQLGKNGCTDPFAYQGKLRFAILLA